MFRSIKYRVGVVLLLVGAVVWAHSNDNVVHGAPRVQARAEILWTRVICKQPERYIGWPSVCVDRDGKLHAVFSGDRDGHVCPWGRVYLISSTDMGESWSEPRVIGNTALDDRDAGIMLLPDGELLVTWFNSSYFLNLIKSREQLKPGSARMQWYLHSKKISSDDMKAQGVYEVRSKDSGATWSKPVRINEFAGDTPHGPIMLKSGRLIYLGRGGRKLLFYESADSGRSWKLLSEMALEQDASEPMMYHEPHGVEMSDGRIVVLIRYHGKDNCMRQIESSDGGKTWSKPVKTELAGLPAHLIRLGDGKVVCVYGRRFGEFGEYACISDDEGRTWDVANEIKLAGNFNGDLGYPASIQLGDGSIVTVYYQPEKEGEPPCLMATRWRVLK